MEYRVLGKTGLQISALGFGGIPIQRIDAEGSKNLMRKVMEAGVNFIDTARGYTVSEEYLGYALVGIRDRFVLASKSMARDKESMARDVDISLKNLRTDYIDLYQFHNPNLPQLEQILAPGGAMEALQEAKASGKIGHIGITLHSVDLLKQVIEYDWVETVMFPYNIVENQAEELFALCSEKNIGVICMKPLAGGALEDASLAMRFVANHPHITVAIPGMANEEELNLNAAAYADNSPLTTEELERIEALRKELGTQFCRRCGYCAPCTVGIPIHNIFTAAGYYNRYGLKNWAIFRYESFPHTASECVGCGACEERCPYHLPIRQMLKDVEATFGK